MFSGLGQLNYAAFVEFTPPFFCYQRFELLVPNTFQNTDVYTDTDTEKKELSLCQKL